MKKIVLMVFALIVLTGVGGEVYAVEETDGSENFEMETSETAGEEWSGEIVEPGNSEIAEPSVPTETPTNTTTEAVSEVVITEVTTTVTPPATPVYTNAVQTEVTHEVENPTHEEAASEEAEAKDFETPKEVEIFDNSSAEEAETVEVPVTAGADNTRKIALLSIVSSGIVLFLMVMIWSGAKILHITKLEREAKKREENLQKIIRQHLNRAS